MEKRPVKSASDGIKLKPSTSSSAQYRNVTAEPAKRAGSAGKRDEQKRSAESISGRRNIAAALIAIVCVIGAWYGITRFRGPAPNIGISTVVGQGVPFGGVAFMASDEQVTDKDWQARAQSFKDFVAKGPVTLDRTDAAQSLSYLAKTLSDPEQKAALSDQVRNKKVDMAAIGFYDDCAEDGDVVGVHSGPLNVVVPLKHTVQYVLVPVPHGETAKVFINGLKDGDGGGITLGMVTPVGIVHMPAMAPGQQVRFLAR
jgi:hypothetical protein